MRKSTFCKFKYTVLSKGYKESQFYKLTVIVANEPGIHWSIVLGKIDLVSVYFRLLWYHGIFEGSIDQKHAKTNEIWRQNSGIHSPFACSHWPKWFLDLSRPYGACVKRGSRETYFWSQSLSSESVVKYPHVGRRKIQISSPLGEQDQSNALPPVSYTHLTLPTKRIV